MSTRRQQSSLVTDTSKLFRSESTGSQTIAALSQTSPLQPSKKRRADGSIAHHAQSHTESRGSRAMGDLQHILPSTPTQMPTRVDSPKEALEEQRLRRAIEEAGRRALKSGQNKQLDLDSRQRENRDEATDDNKAKQGRKDGNDSGSRRERRSRTSSFLEWKEPVLR